MHILLLGPPGSGKGTQAKSLAEALKIPHISTGDMLRQAIQSRTALGEEAKQYMNQGALLPDSLVITMTKDRLAEKDCQAGWVLDGFPRTIAQAKALVETGIVLDWAMVLEVPDAVVIDRISGRRIHMASGRVYHIVHRPPREAGKDDVTGEPLVHRADDYELTIRKRLNVYHAEVAPLIAFYRTLEEQHGQPRVITIDGNLPIDVVRNTMLRYIQS